MRVLNAVQRAVMLLLLIPVLFICLDTLLRALGAQDDNPIVSGIRAVAEAFIIEPFRTVFPDQNYVQNALVTLAALGLLAIAVVAIFRGLRALAASRPAAPARPGPTTRRERPAAGAAAPTPDSDTAPTSEATTDDRSDSKDQSPT